MTRIDTAVVGALVVVLAIIAALVGIPALQATLAPPSAAPTSVRYDADRDYREGLVGHPVSISPLTARSQADRDLVALIFSGLVRNGPDGTIVPDLATDWSVDPSGKEWTFRLADDARWHDGEPVTAEDVVFTIETLQNPDYHGPGSRSWSEVTVRATSPREVVFTLETPLGGFLQAATQPIAPAHLLADVPLDLLPDHPFGKQPVGSGPFALEDLTRDHALLVPAEQVDPADEGQPTPSPVATDSLTTAPPTLRPERPRPYLSGIDLRFYDDADALSAAYRAGDLDAASGLPPAVAATLGTAPDSRLLRYPGTTLTAAILNLRPSHPEFRSPAVRTALLEAIDRTALVETVYGSLAVAGSSLIPPSSPLFDPAVTPAVPYSPDAAKKALKDADWTLKDDGWHAPGADTPLSIEIVSPDASANAATYWAAEAVAEAWRGLGLSVTHQGLPPGEFVMDKLATGDFSVAITDVTIGLDPDLYPLLASSQTRTGGSNVAGVQDPTLDPLLRTARAPGTPPERWAAYSKLQAQLAKGQYLLPLAFQDESVVVRSTVSGPIIRGVADPSDRFWDVLTWRLAAGP